MSYTLFGIELIGIALGLVKLVTDLFKLDDKWATELRAVLITSCAVLVGLQQMGLIFPPESQQYVVFGLGIVSTYLAIRGYLPEAYSFVRAATDNVRHMAFKKASAMWILEETKQSGDIAPESARDFSKGLAQRYGIQFK